MSKREAIKILIQSAHNDIRGSGMGYRSTTEEWREKVRCAIETLWKDAYGWKMSDSDKFNWF